MATSETAKAAETAVNAATSSRSGTAVLEAPVTREVESMIEVDWTMPAQSTLSEQSASNGMLPQQREDDDADYVPGRIAREKRHTADPMTVDQALYEMELVGHDFYLFNDSDAGRPSVVYRRKGFDYGVIRLG